MINWNEKFGFSHEASCIYIHVDRFDPVYEVILLISPGEFGTKSITTGILLDVGVDKYHLIKAEVAFYIVIHRSLNSISKC